MTEKKTGRWWTAYMGSHQLSVNELRRLTYAYWRRGGSLGPRINWYVENLLPQELVYAEARQALGFQTCHTLALLVGYSLEPLLQAISVFQPTRVVLLLNEWYGSQDDPQRQSGSSRGQDVKELIEEFLVPLLGQQLDIDLLTMADRPDAVFRALCDSVLLDQRSGFPVIVDITGAKKSMDAGAFLFAAYADIPISYVDFDEYHEKERRPFGFTCRIGTLANPYDSFKLRKWEEVQHLYDKYHFRAAWEALQEIIPVMQRSLTAQGDSLLFDRSHVTAAKRLRLALRFYQAWDDGDHRRAWRLLPYLESFLMSTFLPPAVVKTLGKEWRPVSAGAVARPSRQMREERIRLDSDFLASTRRLLAYARDELAKVKRLVEENEDNRSALLRAIGLDELLLKARWVRLWNRGRVELYDQNERDVRSCSDINPGLQKALYEKLLNHQDNNHMRAALQRSGVFDKRLDERVLAFLRLDAWRGTYRARPDAQVPPLSHYQNDISVNVQVLNDFRNQAIHKYQYVSQFIAEQAFRLVEANLQQFEKGEGRNLASGDSGDEVDHTGTDALSWQTLGRLCGLDFLPLITH